MKFIVSSNELLQRLKKLERVIASKNTLPILDNFLFQIKGKELTLTASDADSTMTTNILLDNVDEDGLFAVPAKVLVDALVKMPNKALVFELSNQEIKISTETGSFTLMSADGSVFPITPKVQWNSISILSEDFVSAIVKCNASIKDDPFRPITSAVLLRLDKSVSFVGINLHGVSFCRVLETETDYVSDLVIPIKHYQVLKSVLPRNCRVSICFDNKNGRADFDGYSYVFRLVEGTYPDFNSIIPKYSNFIQVDRAELISKINIVSVFGSRISSMVIFKVSENIMQITSQDIDYKMSAKETLNCKFDGEIEIALNPERLTDILQVVDSDDVDIDILSSTHAVRIRPTGNENEYHILAPMLPG